MMKFRKYREFAEAISEALKKLMDDEWHSGRLRGKNQTSYLSILKKEKQKELENYISIRLLPICRKIPKCLSKQKDFKPEQKG